MNNLFIWDDGESPVWFELSGKVIEMSRNEFQALIRPDDISALIEVVRWRLEQAGAEPVMAGVLA